MSPAVTIICQVALAAAKSDVNVLENYDYSYLFLLIHFEQFGNRSGVKSESVRIRF